MPDLPTEYYSNAVNVIRSIYDVTLEFNTNTPVGIKEGKPSIIQAASGCRVRMSPQHAKALAALLMHHVVEYEKQFNMTLPLEDNIDALWKELCKKE